MNLYSRLLRTLTKVSPLLVPLLSGIMGALIGSVGAFYLQREELEHKVWTYYMDKMTGAETMDSRFSQLSTLTYMVDHEDRMPGIKLSWAKKQFCRLFIAIDSEIDTDAEELAAISNGQVRVSREDREVEGCDQGKSSSEYCRAGYAIIRQSDLLHNLYGPEKSEYCPNTLLELIL